MTAPRIIWPYLYKVLVDTVELADRTPPTHRIWQRAWNTVASNGAGYARVRIHNQEAVVNIGNTYPLNSRRFRMLNSPIVELVQKCYTSSQRPITFVDVGAAIGDTILLLMAKCPGMLGEFYCIDGDPEFFGYLECNAGHLPGAHLIRAMLSSASTTERSLVRIHGGTASAQGQDQVPATSLDSVISEVNPESIEVLKIDVDGFDGKVLLGCRGVLDLYQPCVVFEWHPILCVDTANNYTDHFESLVASHYEHFLWFDKFGRFSHFMKALDLDAVSLMAEYCQKDRALDMHFDVVALPRRCKISPLDLASLSYSRARA